MKKSSKSIIIMIAAVVLAVSVLTGCSSTPTEKDAKAYVQAVLDMMCKGEYDHSVNIVDIEEGEEGNFREEAVDEAIDSMGIDFDDENRARFKEIMLNAFSKAKYTVGNATKTGEGEYDVEVTIEPLKSGAGDQEEFNNRVAAIDTTNMTEEEYTKAVYGVLLDLLEESVNNPVYGEPQTTTVHYGLLDKENNVYGVSEEDGNKLGSMLFYAE